MKVVIIGGVAGGATAAARIRRLDEKADIVVFEKSGFVSYANCGLPYYIGGVIDKQSKLTVQTPKGFKDRFNIDMRVLHEVTDIDPGKKTVTVKDLQSGNTFEESYDKLLITTGARPTKPDIPGDGIENLFSLRTVEDTVRIRKFVEEKNPRSVVLSGGGFISLELAENFRDLGMEVTIVQRPNQLMNHLDIEMAAFLHAKMRQKGINLLLGTGVEGFEALEDGSVKVLLNKGCPLKADMAVLAIGVTPDTDLAKKAGLELGIKGSMVVNEHMETSVPDIYAAGDAVEIKQYITGEKALISLAGPANKQGRIAADNICGIKSTYKGSQASSVLQVFDMTVGLTGISESLAKSAGIDCDKIYLSPMNHASYYPGSKIMTMKVIFEKGTMRLLGAQIIGSEGVDKRIDVLSTAMYMGMKATDLKDLDLAYAPPYSSAKDPVNMAGFMAENIEQGKLTQFFLEDIDELPRDGSVQLLDVRTEKEYSMGHVDGFKNMPVDDLRDRIGELDKSKKVYVMCQAGLRGYIAYRILEGYGFDCCNFSGGYRLYETVKLDKEAKETATLCGMEI